MWFQPEMDAVDNVRLCARIDRVFNVNASQLGRTELHYAVLGDSVDLVEDLLRWTCEDPDEVFTRFPDEVQHTRERLLDEMNEDCAYLKVDDFVHICTVVDPTTKVRVDGAQSLLRRSAACRVTKRAQHMAWAACRDPESVDRAWMILEHTVTSNEAADPIETQDPDVDEHDLAADDDDDLA